LVFCDNCGHELKPTAKFCAKCGTKIDEMPKKEKPSISQDTGQPTTESKDWKIRKTQPDETDTPYEAVMRENYGHTKKQSGRFKKFAIGCGIFMVALVILAGFGSSNTEPTFTACTGVGCPGSATTSADIPLEFDPLIVASARENIPQMQEISKVVLKECRDVNSYSDYQVFALAVAATEGSIAETILGVGEVLMILELEGYDEHPEVGPLIKETRSLQLEASYCIDDLLMRYGN
jgi:rRNA maturation endonuclease Nob1